MLKIEEIEGTEALHLVSDDQNAENVAIDEAVQLAAPHLYPDWSDTAPGDDGMLRWRVQRPDYDALLEVLDAIEMVNPEDVLAATELVELKLKELQS